MLSVFSVALIGEATPTKISAENSFSLPICVIMGLTKSLPCVKGGAERMRGGGIVKAKRKRKTIPQSPSATAPFAQGSLGMRSFIFRGMGFARCLCNTNVKLAIK